jgi:integrase/recombinase XerD
VYPSEQYAIVQNLKRPRGIKSPTRRVYYGETTAEKLKRWLASGRDKYRYAAESPYLFPSSHGERYSTQHVNQIVKDAAEAADIQKYYATDSKGDDRAVYTCHALRHSFAVHRVLDDCPISYIAEMMGDSMETVETYLQVRDEDVREANNRHRPRV